MQEATKYSDTRLKEQAKAREDVKEKEMVDLMIGLSELNDADGTTRQGK